jgi:hypothetical protein
MLIIYHHTKILLLLLIPVRTAGFMFSQAKYNRKKMLIIGKRFMKKRFMKSFLDRMSWFSMCLNCAADGSASLSYTLPMEALPDEWVK